MTKKKTPPKPKPPVTKTSAIDWLPIYSDCKTWCEINFQAHCEDVMQQVFVNLSTSEVIPDNPHGYFKTCAYNEYLKQIKPKPSEFMRVEVETDKILIEDIYQTIAHLSEFDRNVFMLHLIHGLPIVRIARLTMIPVGVLYESLRVSKQFVRSNFTA
jgi:DNA-directed RNA polymerase specialized sigma24 family protein